MATKKQLKWGSQEWETHLRRSLAQRKRHGADIKDIEGLIAYIKGKGPAQKQSSSSNQNNKRTIRSSTIIVNARSHRQRLL